MTASLETRLKAEAYAEGFDLAGIARLGESETGAAFQQWLANGYAGEMGYLARSEALRLDSRLPHPGAHSALVVGLNYGGTQPAGPVAKYARGDDYHDVMRAKLRRLHAWLETELGHSVNGRPYVDTGPVLERELARRAGLGWFGKNTMLINPGLGSHFFLGALFVELALEPDAPFAADRCGSCTRCLDACPTKAFVEPRVLDATRCISYLTIELRGSIPVELRERVGSWLYGCDVCQDVCPWNVKFSRPSGEPAFAPRAVVGDVDARLLARAVLAMSEEEYRVVFRGSAMTRAKRRGLQRNAAVVLGNVGRREDISLLESAMAERDAVVREHIPSAVGSIAMRAGPIA